MVMKRSCRHSLKLSDSACAAHPDPFSNGLEFLERGSLFFIHVETPIDLHHDAGHARVPAVAPSRYQRSCEGIVHLNSPSGASELGNEGLSEQLRLNPLLRQVRRGVDGRSAPVTPASHPEKEHAATVCHLKCGSR